MTQNNSEINFKKVYINASIIFIIDALLWQQGIVAAITIFISGFIFLPLSLFRHMKSKEENGSIKKYLIYCTAGILVFISFYLNNIFAKSQAEYLVQKIELFKSETGLYPTNLNELTPKYFSRVPIAKVSLGFNHFFYYYREQDKDPMLFYVVYPPFYRNGYNFQKHVWHTFD